MAKFSGVIPPVVSPMKTPDALDLEAVDRVIEHLIGGGVSGLFVLGTTGSGRSHGPRPNHRTVQRSPADVGPSDACWLPKRAPLGRHR